MMVYVTVNELNHITATYTKEREGTYAVKLPLPTPTEEQHLEYKGGKVVAVDNVSKSDLRREAYRAEVDEMANTYVNYKADAKKARKDGDEALADKYDAIAEAIFDEIGEKRVAIRERYPDEVAQ